MNSTITIQAMQLKILIFLLYKNYNSQNLLSRFNNNPNFLFSFGDDEHKSEFHLGSTEILQLLDN